MKLKVAQSCPTLWDPMECGQAGSSVHGMWPAKSPPPIIFSRQEYWSGQLFPSSGDLPNPGIEPRSPALQVDSLLSELLRKPKNTGVGSSIPSPEDLPNPGIKSRSPALQTDSLTAQLPGKPFNIGQHCPFANKMSFCKNNLDHFGDWQDIIDS